jgi:predicted Rossmann fold flavoprotein
MSELWDAIVVGAGAAGLLAATRAAELGSRVLLLEKNRKAGVKILMSGGTRCNITHDCDARGIVDAFGRNGTFLHSALAALSPKDVRAIFHDEGVQTKVEPGGKVFPMSDRALDVRDALVRRAVRGGVESRLGDPVLSTSRSGDLFEVRTPCGLIHARKLLITTGGASYPGCGTTGDGYSWAESFGHTIIRPRPALVPLKTDVEWIKSLSGLTLPDVRASVWPPENESSRKSKPLDEYRGGFLFTHWGFSGPAPLNVSKAVTSHPEPRRLVLECDFLPEVPRTTFGETLKARCRQHGKRRVSGLLTDLPNRLADGLLAATGIPLQRNLAELSNEERGRVVAAVKATRVPLAGALGFEKAEVTAGGVSLSEIDSRTMQSKLVPGLFFAGEIIDLDGRIGGYNFQSAFSTGWSAGTSLGAPS